MKKPNESSSLDLVVPGACDHEKVTAFWLLAFPWLRNVVQFQWLLIWEWAGKPPFFALTSTLNWDPLAPAAWEMVSLRRQKPKEESCLYSQTECNMTYLDQKWELERSKEYHVPNTLDLGLLSGITSFKEKIWGKLPFRTVTTHITSASQPCFCVVLWVN